MINEALEALATEDFDAAVGPTLQADLLWKRLRSTEQVQRLRKALDQGGVTDGEVGDFVANLVAAFRAGERLRYEMALAGVAVALEHRHTRFADQYLETLSSLRLAELGSASRVAALCVNHRANRPKTERREVQFEVPQERIEVRTNTQVPLSQRPTVTELNF